MREHGETFALRRFARLAARGTAWVSGLFSLIVATLLFANVLQLRSTTPLDNSVLTRSRDRLLENPEDDPLAEDIRALDLMARKAYFTRRWQIRTGSYLLLGGAVVFMASVALLGFLNAGPPVPAAERRPREEARWGRAGIALFAVLLLGAVGVLGFLRPGGMPAVRATSEAGAASTAVAASAAPASAAEMARNWPYFRGTDAARREAGDYPLEWDGAAGQGVLWKVPVPRPGFNSPVVWEDRVFLSGADARVREIYCFAAADGALLWRTRIDGVPGSPRNSPEVTEDTGYAAPGLATEGSRVFALFANGDLACVDFQGAVLWSRNLGVPDNHYGHSSSLLVRGDRLLVQYDHAAEARLLALDTTSGETVWETPREVMTSWASPILVRAGDRPLVVLSANPYVAAYDPESGREVWRAEGMMGEVGPSPAFGGGRVYAVNQYSVLMALDAEIGEKVWETYQDLPDVSSPVADENRLYVATSYGVVSCWSGADGALLWQQELEDGFYASPVLVGDLVYLLDRGGVMRIFRAADACQEVGSSPLGEESDCTAAFVNGRIYIRGSEHLYCIAGEGGGAE